LTDFSLIKFIDYINIQNVKNDYYSLSTWNWNAIYVKPDEPVTSFVFDDSFKKIHDNINLINLDIAYKFVINLDEHDEFVSHTLSAIHTSEQILSSSSYRAIGINEIVAYETINRGFNNIYCDLDKLRRILEVRYERDNGDFICWSWRSQTALTPQSPATGKKPFSWLELRNATSTKNIYLSSGVRWTDMNTCCDAANSMPITWIWNRLTCCDVPYITWVDTRCGNIFNTSWKDLMNSCDRTPNYYFDDCITGC
jgi:hypothetical protein